MESISLPLPAEDVPLAAAAATSMRAQHRGTDIEIDGHVVTLSGERMDPWALRSAWRTALLTERLIARSAEHRARVLGELLG